MNACIKETLRLHSTAKGVLPRIANKDHTLNNLKIYKGTVVECSFLSMWYDYKRFY